MKDAGTSRRRATIVSADVAGFSRLMGVDEEGTLAAFKSHRQELIDPKIAECGGRVVNVAGDGMLMEFSSAVDALECCIAVQRGIVTRNQTTPIERRLQFRIGINVADVIVDGDDIFGDGVNIAARLEGVADPGGICVSQAVVDQTRDILDLEFQDLGRRALKNIEQPVRTYRIASAGIGVGVTGSGSVAVDIVPRLPERPSLAILPFRNLNGTEDTEFVADGIGLSIQTLLVQLSGLFFINACSNQPYKEGRASAVEAMRDFPVRYALEGSVQRVGQRVRVTAQVTDLSDGEAVWADRYDRDLEDVFVLQDDITREVIISLSIEIPGAVPERISIRSLAGPGAWEPYLRGVSHFYKFTREDNAIARRMFEKVSDLFPDKTIGPGYIALTHWIDVTRGWSASRDASLSQAAEWAEKSTVSVEENNGLAHAVLGSVRLLEGEFDEALALCRRSIAFRANCPFALGQLAAVQNYCGDATGAAKSAREALSVRTVYPPPLLNILAIAYRDSGKVGLSIPTALEASRLDPKFVDAYATVCSDYALLGDDDEARRAADEIMEIDPEFRLSTYAKKHVYKDAEKIAGIVEALRSAGLPD